MEQRQLDFLGKVYNQMQLQCQSKALITSMILNSDKDGKVNMDYDYYRSSLPLKDFKYFTSCLSTLYKYKWLIKDSNNDTFINYNI